MARSVRNILNDPRLYDLEDGEQAIDYDFIDRIFIQRQMVASRSTARKPIKVSKPIGKKHYRKTIRRDNVLYVADGQIDNKGMMTYSPIDSI